MAILISTTGTQSTVIFNDLGGRTISHPVVDLNITLEYELEDLRESADFQGAIDAGWITVKDENDNAITDASSLDDRKADAANITKDDVELGNADNTSDVDKPVSTAQQTALDGKVDDSQVLTDVPLGAVFTDTTYTDAEIKTKYENNTDTNEFDDTEKAKLTGIEDNATADQIAAEVTYAPAVPGDWTVTPDDVKEALDEIAFRAKTIENGGGIDTDAQIAEGSTVASTTSGTFTDMPGMSVVTNNNIDRKYLVLFSGTFTGGSNKILGIEIIIDGIPATSSLREHKVSSNSAEFTVSTQFLSGSLATAKTIKIQWRTSSGTVNVFDRSLVIYSIEGN